MTLFLILALIAFTFYGGLISAWETALFSLSSMQLKSYQRSHEPKKQLIATILSRPRELIVSLLILNTLPNLLIQNIAANLFGDNSSWILKVGVPIVITLIFSEVVPKALGFSNNVKVAQQGIKHIAFLQKVIGPVANFFSFITSYVSRTLFFFLKKEEEISEEELHHVLKTSEQRGILDPDEAELIDGYLTLQEASVKELMRPRDEILFYDLKEPLSKLIHLFVEEACTRIPVVDDHLEEIKGIMTASQFFIHKPEIHHPVDLLPFLQKPFYIPETTPAKVLLRQFSARKEPLALVVDEYGSLAGLITYEDLVETVVGEISSRRDQKSLYTRSGEDILIASGKLELTELEDIFGVAFESPGYMLTIGGWLTERLGNIPPAGTEYESEGFLFHILASDPNRIKRIYIRRLKIPQEGHSNA